MFSKKYVLLVLLSSLAAYPLFAKWDGKDSKKTFFLLEGGMYMNNISQRLNAPVGYESELSDWKGFARFHVVFPIGKNWTFEPSLGTMLPARAGIDGNTKAFESQLGLQFGFPIFSFLRFRFGPGVEWMWMRSEGATLSLNNGGGTSSFYVPDRNSHLLIFTMTSGLSIHLFGRLFMLADLYIPEVLDGARRRYHASMTLGFAL